MSALQQQDVARILRDVLSTYGVRASVLSVEQAPNGWQVVVTDTAHRILSTDVIDGPAALVRTALTTWVLNQH
jgi:hypothetical protein